LLLDSTDLGFEFGPCCKPFHPHRIRLLGVQHSRFVLGAKEVNDFLEFGCLHEKNAHIQTCAAHHVLVEIEHGTN
jgi:hypothetical protein